MRGQSVLGIWPACSHSSMWGDTSRSTKPRTVCRNISCCSSKIFTGSMHSTLAGAGQGPRGLRSAARGCYMNPMLQEHIEGKWIETFAGVFRLCQVRAGEDVAIPSETQSRPVNVKLAELALLALGARPFHVVVPTPPQRA